MVRNNRHVALLLVGLMLVCTCSDRAAASLAVQAAEHAGQCRVISVDTGSSLTSVLRLHGGPREALLIIQGPNPVAWTVGNSKCASFVNAVDNHCVALQAKGCSWRAWRCPLTVRT